jgi:putative membrane protein
MKVIAPGLVLCFLPLLAFGATPGATGNVTAEQAFVTRAGQAGLAEIEMAKLAQARSKDEAIRTFSAHMVKEHQRANEELSALAKRKNLTVPTALDGQNATIMHRLSAKPASEFDAEYGTQMVAAHEAAAIVFSDAAALRDKDLIAYAKKMLDAVKSHQALAASLPTKKPARTADGSDLTISPSAGPDSATAAGDAAVNETAPPPEPR